MRTATPIPLWGFPAGTLLAITGANAETRKAALVVQLSESPANQCLLSEARVARERVADAE